MTTSKAQIAKERKKLYADLLAQSQFATVNPEFGQSNGKVKLPTRLVDAIAASEPGRSIECLVCKPRSRHDQLRSCDICGNRRRITICDKCKGSGWDALKQERCRRCEGIGAFA
jgi:hypothetical protein